MDYGYLINQAFRVTWKYKFLWIFGFFIGGGANFNLPLGNFPDTTSSQDVDRFGETAASWVASHLGLLLAIALFLFLIWIIFFILGIIAQAAIIWSVDQAETANEPTFKAAFQVGMSHFWRLLGLLIIVFLIILAALLILAAPVIVLIVTAVLNKSFEGVILIILLALFLLLIFFLFAVVLGLVSTYAMRYLVISESRVLESLGQGWRLVRSHLGPTLLVWLLNVGFGIAFGIGFAIFAIIIALPFIILFIALFAAGLSPLKIVLAFVTALILMLLFSFIAGIAQVFFSSIWTLAWRQLTGGVSADTVEAPLTETTS